MGGTRAVRWLEDTDGRVVIFTRGEYRDQIMRTITPQDPVLYFHEIKDDE